MRTIFLSQLLALIAVSFDTKKVTTFPSIVVFGETKEAVTGNEILITWKRGRVYGHEEMHLWLFLDKFEDERPIFHAYYFDGDNCNERSRFIYSVMAEKTEIVDDIALTGAGESINSRTNLLKINPHDIEVMRSIRERWKEE